MSDSILLSTKKVLGIAEDYNAFDVDIAMHINSVFVTLNELGVGPPQGFVIEDEGATWGQYLLSNPKMQNVKTYMYLRVKLLFDPPGTSYLIESLRKQATELEWRMQAMQETAENSSL